MNSKDLLFLLVSYCLTILEVSEGRRVIDRLPGSRYPVFERCRLALAIVAGGDSVSRLAESAVREFSPAFAAKLVAMNCTFESHFFDHVGELDCNASYSGAIGIIQQNEAELVGSLSRDDSFPVVLSRSKVK